MMWPRLQYITQDHAKMSHSELCLRACQSGIQWIQLRMKNVSQERLLEQAEKCRKITNEYKVCLIINDNVNVAQKVNADGVHLGKQDMSVGQARNILGQGKIIGGTANTLEDIKELYKEGANYLGLGPYKFTRTKKNLSNLLGLKGFQEIIYALKEKNAGIPIYAIGGITDDDLRPLLGIGITGVAISGYITNLLAEDAFTFPTIIKDIPNG